MRAEFRYKGRRKGLVIRVIRYETGFPAAFAVFGRVISFLGVIKKLLGH
jgi:hypothetical protein